MSKPVTHKWADITFEKDRFLIQGDLHFSNVMSIYEKSLQQLKTTAMLDFDFSQLQSSDSAGLALILEWIKFAKHHRKSIRFIALSEDLLEIAKAAGLDKMIYPAISQ